MVKCTLGALSLPFLLTSAPLHRAGALFKVFPPLPITHPDSATEFKTYCGWHRTFKSPPILIQMPIMWYNTFIFSPDSSCLRASILQEVQSVQPQMDSGTVGVACYFTKTTQNYRPTLLWLSHAAGRRDRTANAMRVQMPIHTVNMGLVRLTSNKHELNPHWRKTHYAAGSLVHMRSHGSALSQVVICSNPQFMHLVVWLLGVFWMWSFPPRQRLHRAACGGGMSWQDSWVLRGTLADKSLLLPQRVTLCHLNINSCALVKPPYQLR